MTTTIRGTDNTAAAPALTGTDTATGIFFPSTGVMAFSTAGTEDMRIDSVGNVGIGTTSPVTGNSKLTVINGVTAQDGTTPALQLYNTGGGANQKYLRIVSTTSGVLNFEKVNDAYSSATGLFGVTSAGLFQFNSGYGSVATAFGCRAWGKITSAGAVSGSGNLTSVTKTGTGTYTLNFTAAMPDTQYSVVGSAQNQFFFSSDVSSYSTGSAGARVFLDNGVLSDNNFTFAVFR